MKNDHRRTVLRGVLVLALAAVGLLIAASLPDLGPLRSPTCSSGELAPTRGYVLISLDTVAAQDLSVYGYGRPTTPFLEELGARRGAVVEHAFVHYPLTLHSHMTLFTGLYPGENGVVTAYSVLSDQVPTLPEVFRDAGFLTAGYTEGGPVSGFLGFNRGFEHFEDRGGMAPDQMEQTFAQASSFLRRLDDQTRFLLFLHTFAAHTPYDPPSPFPGRYRVPQPGDCPGSVSHFYRPQGAHLASPECAAFHRARYDDGLNYVDAVLRSFFADLDELGLTDEVTVIITADHGEEFMQHGRMEHGQLYHENLHVPLIVIHPALGGQRIDGIAGLVDVAPTLFDLAELDPPERISGRTLAPLLQGGGDDVIESYAVADYGARCLLDPDLGELPTALDYERHHSESLYRLQDGRLYHLIRHLQCPDIARLDDLTPLPFELELYETSVDPQETTNLCAEQPSLCQEMATRLEAYHRQPVAPTRRITSTEYEDQLRALGYVP